MFRNAIQKALKKGRLKLAKKGEMTIHSNPFGSRSTNMVLISTTHKEQKKKVPRWGQKLKEKDEAGPLSKHVWRPKSTVVKKIGGHESSHKISVLQRLQHLGQLKDKLGYHNQLKQKPAYQTSNHGNNSPKNKPG